MATIKILQSLTITAALIGAVVVSHCAAGDHTACDGESSDCLPAASVCRCPFGRICARCKDKACVTTASPGKETKSCWEVECDDVCIPAVRFPWDCCRKSTSGDCLGTLLPRCGKVRRVRKLKGVEYECDKCEYDHQIVEKSSDCGAIPYGHCLPPSAAVPLEDDAQMSEPAEGHEASLASPDPAEESPHWSDRFRPRWLNVNERAEQPPAAVEGDLSRYIGHSIPVNVDAAADALDGQ